MYRASLAFIRSHYLLFIGFIVALVLSAALWTRRRMKRKFGGGLSTPTFALGEKRGWGHESNGSEGHTHQRQSSGKNAGQSKFD